MSAVPDMTPEPGLIGAVQRWAQASRTTTRFVMIVAATIVLTNACTVSTLIIGTSIWQTSAILSAYADARTTFARGRSHTDSLLDRNRKDVLAACQAKGR